MPISTPMHLRKSSLRCLATTRTQMGHCFLRFGRLQRLAVSQALQLYAQHGFQKIDPYDELSPQLREWLVFMELPLLTRATRTSALDRIRSSLGPHEWSIWQDRRAGSALLSR